MGRLEAATALAGRTAVLGLHVVHQQLQRRDAALLEAGEEGLGLRLGDRLGDGHRVERGPGRIAEQGREGLTAHRPRLQGVRHRLLLALGDRPQQLHHAAQHERVIEEPQEVAAARGVEDDPVPLPRLQRLGQLEQAGDLLQALQHRGDDLAQVVLAEHLALGGRLLQRGEGLLGEGAERGRRFELRGKETRGPLAGAQPGRLVTQLLLPHVGERSRAGGGDEEHLLLGGGLGEAQRERRRQGGLAHPTLATKDMQYGSVAHAYVGPDLPVRWSRSPLQRCGICRPAWFCGRAGPRGRFRIAPSPTEKLERENPSRRPFGVKQSLGESGLSSALRRHPEAGGRSPLPGLAAGEGGQSEGGLLGRAGLRRVAVELVVEGLLAHPQGIRGPGLVAPVALERGQQVLALHHVHGEAEGDLEALPLPGPRPHVRRQVVAQDELAVAEDDRALHGVAQLADVPRPLVAAEDLQGQGVHPRHVLARLGVELVHEVLHQDGDVLAPVAQGRQGDLEDVEAEEEVLPEALGLDLRLELAVRRAEHPDVHLQLHLAAQPAQPPLLEDPQQLGLQLEGDLPHLVQEERPPVRPARRPPAGADRRR